MLINSLRRSHRRKARKLDLNARFKAHAAASPGDWLSAVLEHHEQIEAAFAAVKAANTPNAQVAAQMKLALILTGHANAEESVIYPALAGANEKGHATTAYGEQAAAKIQMGLLERLTPMTADYSDKLEHIRGAVAHHMYEEEGNWFCAFEGEGDCSRSDANHPPLRRRVRALCRE